MRSHVDQNAFAASRVKHVRSTCEMRLLCIVRLTSTVFGHTNVYIVGWKTRGGADFDLLMQGHDKGGGGHCWPVT